MYVRSSEAEIREYDACHNGIVTIDGLSELAKTPFILRLLCAAMAMIIRGRAAHVGTKLARAVTRTDIYSNFIGFVAGRQMWRCVTRSYVPLEVDYGGGSSNGERV